MLNKSFGTPNDIEQHKTSCTIFNICIWEEASITDHVLYMIEQIEHLSKLNFFLHEQPRQDVILNSQLKSYLLFLSHYRMTKSVINYHDLLKLLQTFEKNHQLHEEMVNVVRGSSVGHHPFRKGKKKNKNKKVQHAGDQTKKSKSKFDQS